MAISFQSGSPQFGQLPQGSHGDASGLINAGQSIQSVGQSVGQIQGIQQDRKMRKIVNDWSEQESSWLDGSLEYPSEGIQHYWAEKIEGRKDLTADHKDYLRGQLLIPTQKRALSLTQRLTEQKNQASHAQEVRSGSRAFELKFIPAFDETLANYSGVEDPETLAVETYETALAAATEGHDDNFVQAVRDQTESRYLANALSRLSAKKQASASERLVQDMEGVISSINDYSAENINQVTYQDVADLADRMDSVASDLNMLDRGVYQEQKIQTGEALAQQAVNGDNARAILDRFGVTDTSRRNRIISSREEHEQTVAATRRSAQVKYEKSQAERMASSIYNNPDAWIASPESRTELKSQALDAESKIEDAPDDIRPAYVKILEADAWLDYYENVVETRGVSDDAIDKMLSQLPDNMPYRNVVQRELNRMKAMEPSERIEQFILPKIDPEGRLDGSGRKTMTRLLLGRKELAGEVNQHIPDEYFHNMPQREVYEHQFPSQDVTRATEVFKATSPEAITQLYSAVLSDYKDSAPDLLHASLQQSRNSGDSRTVASLALANMALGPKTQEELYNGEFNTTHMNLLARATTGTLGRDRSLILQDSGMTDASISSALLRHPQYGNLVKYMESEIGLLDQEYPEVRDLITNAFLIQVEHNRGTASPRESLNQIMDIFVGNNIGVVDPTDYRTQLPWYGFITTVSSVDNPDRFSPSSSIILNRTDIDAITDAPMGGVRQFLRSMSLGSRRELAQNLVVEFANSFFEDPKSQFNIPIPTPFGQVLTLHQMQGRGRFDKEEFSKEFSHSKIHTGDFFFTSPDRVLGEEEITRWSDARKENLPMKIVSEVQEGVPGIRLYIGNQIHDPESPTGFSSEVSDPTGWTVLQRNDEEGNPQAAFFPYSEIGDLYRERAERDKAFWMKALKIITAGVF